MDQLPFLSGNGELELVKYTDKCAVIRGTPKNPTATKPIKDKIINDCGGKWNAALKEPTNPEKRFMGWIIPQSKVQACIDMIKNVAGGGGTTTAAPATAPAQQQQQQQQQDANNNNNSSDQLLFNNSTTENNNNNTSSATSAAPAVDMPSFPVISADGQVEAIQYKNSIVLRGVATNPSATKTHIPAIKATFETAKYNGMLTDPQDPNKKFAGWLIMNKEAGKIEAFLKNQVTNTPVPSAADIAKANGPATPALFVSADGKVKVISYSDYSVAVKLTSERDPTLFAKLVKEFEGKYNRNLRDPGNSQPFVGVIISKKKSDELKNWLVSYTVAAGGNESGQRRGREE